MSHGTSGRVPSALLADLRARSAEIEQLRRLPDDVVQAMRDAGLYRLWVPDAYGGPEATAQEGLDAIVALSEADGGAGWCLMIALTNTIPAHLLPAEHAKEIYSPEDVITGGFAAPKGTAVPRPDGSLEVTGRWQWGSGTSHCTWIAGGCRIVDDAGDPAALPDGTAFPFVFFERDDVVLHDTWHVMGMAGSGSTDYSVERARVPAGRWVQFGLTQPTIEIPLSRFPMFGLLAAGLAAVSVGRLRRGIAELVDMAGGKRPQGSRKTLAERPATQIDVAQAEATARSSWAFLCDAVGDAWTSACAGDPLSVEQRRLLRLASTDAVARCAVAAQRLHVVAGGADVYLSSEVQRVFRDANVVSQHAMTAERTYELPGRLALGLQTDAAQL